MRSGRIAVLWSCVGRGGPASIAADVRSRNCLSLSPTRSVFSPSLPQACFKFELSACGRPELPACAFGSVEAAPPAAPPPLAALTLSLSLSLSLTLFSPSLLHVRFKFDASARGQAKWLACAPGTVEAAPQAAPPPLATLAHTISLSLSLSHSLVHVSSLCCPPVGRPSRWPVHLDQ